MPNIDLKLLGIVSVLQKTRSVSKTAKRLGLSQSTVSMTLAKLRDHFHDPLFVRTSSGMEATPYGAEIIGHLKRAEEILQSVLEHHATFLPISADRIFHIHSTDIAQVTLLPKLMRRFQRVAPLLRVELTRMSNNTPRLLESGEADLAVGFIMPMGGGFCRQRLFKDRFICAVRGDHPRVRDELTLEQFQSETHLEIATSGTGHGIVGKILEQKNIRRRIGLTVPSFLGITSIVTTMDFLAVIPAQLGLHLASVADIKMFELPVEIPAYFITQHWHERYSNDCASKWLRSIMADLFLEHTGNLAAPARAKIAAVSPMVAPEKQHSEIGPGTANGA
jgi:DNA-binding transcriptional LysR family regulator